jgi:two-component system, response regulator / RNA-binding antiterminator
MLRVLVVDESAERAEILREGLARAGHEVAASLSSPLELLRAVERVQPDVIIIDTDSATRDVLEHVVIVSRDCPRPIVMFARDDDAETIREVTRAGVSAYVVDGLEAARVKAIVEAACARFEAFQALRDELAAARDELAARKVIERAKGILMRAKDLDEDAAYAQLRRLAMNRGKRLVDVAQSIVDAADLLG